MDIGPYRALPQVDFNYYQNALFDSPLNFKLFSQAVHFDNKSPLMPKAWRFHAEPSINLPLSNRYGSLNIETKLYATHYQQTQGRAAEAEQVERKSIVSCHKSKWTYKQFWLASKRLLKVTHKL